MILQNPQIEKFPNKWVSGDSKIVKMIYEAHRKVSCNLKLIRVVSIYLHTLFIMILEIAILISLTLTALKLLVTQETKEKSLWEKRNKIRIKIVLIKSGLVIGMFDLANEILIFSPHPRYTLSIWSTFCLNWGLFSQSRHVLTTLVGDPRASPWQWSRTKWWMDNIIQQSI